VRLAASGASSSLCGGISGHTFAVALYGAALSMEMDAGVAASDFFGDLGDHCGRKGSMMPDSRGSVRLNPSSPCGEGDGGGSR
jgi:hypothetical protein